MTRVAPLILETPAEIGRELAVRILDGLDSARAAGRPYLLGCPGGRSAKPVYDTLGALLAAAPRPIAHLVIVMMDEYVVETQDGFACVDPNAHFSCRRFAFEEIAAVLNQGLAEADRVPADAIWLPDPAAPEDYDARIEAAGGIDLFLLASGASDGHVAFNPAGTSRGTRSHIVTLAIETRRDNMKTFPDFRDISEVPTYGVSVGVDTIARLSKSAAMIVWGRQKQLAFWYLTHGEHYDPAWPATVIFDCREPSLYADRDAAERTTEQTS